MWHSELVRYVAIGDSLSEGIGDEPWPDGTPRGWTDRLAEMLAAHHSEVHYANLAVRGYQAAQVREAQLLPAVAMEPDLVTLTAGMNDILRPRVDFGALRATLVSLVEPFVSRGAKLVVVPIPDVTAVSPMGRLLRARGERLSALYRELADQHGIQPVTDTRGTLFEDPRAWAADRLHLSPLGHHRLALAAAADFGLRVDDWRAPVEEPRVRRTVRADVTWARQYVVPWLGRRLTGRSSGDGRQAKRPALAPFHT